MNAVYWRHGLSRGIWKNTEVKSMENRAGRILLRSIISFMLDIFHPSLDNFIRVTEVHSKLPPVGWFAYQMNLDQAVVVKAVWLSDPVPLGK